MVREKRSAVGVTAQPGGPLVANLSASDLRGLTPERWGMLALPVAEFLVQQHGVALPSVAAAMMEAPPDRPKIYVGVARARGGGEEPQELTSYVAVITVGPSTLLGGVLEALAENSVHHVYVTDDEDRPIGIITPTDVLKVRTLCATLMRRVRPTDDWACGIAAHGHDDLA